jgi:preprotein translocase subunit SecA
MLSNAIENAQKKVESRNFQSRKSVLEYDDVMNTQRTLIYKQRAQVLDGDDLKTSVRSMIDDVIDASVKGVEDIGDEATLREVVAPFEGVFIAKGEIPFTGAVKRDELEETLKNRARAVYDAKEKSLGAMADGTTPLMRELERVILLRVVDEYWMEHIDAMEELRDSVRLRAYGQENPVDAYKRDGFDMFEQMIDGIKEEVTRRIFTARVQTQQTIARKGVTKNIQAQAANAGGDDSVKKQPVKTGAKVGRNDPCPCGARKEDGTPVKYKNCHGRDA